MSEAQWPTVREAASEIGTSGQYVHKLITQGKLTGRLRGNTWLIDPVSWQAFKTQRAKRLASTASLTPAQVEGRAEARRVAALIDAGQMPMTGHNDLLNLIAKGQAHAAA
jgi:hypothetical protein